MIPQSATDRDDRLRARQIPQAIRYLRVLKVPATRIAGILGDSVANIRQIDLRSRKATPSRVQVATLDKDDLALLRLTETERTARLRLDLQCIRIRTKQDLEQVETTVWSIFRSHQSVGLEQGYEALKKMLPGVANARHGQALKVRLLIEEKLAWFALPSGHIREALTHAQAAMNFALDALRESAGEKQYLLRYGEAALVASLCLQKMHRPKKTLSFITAADQANEAAGQLPGSEHLRQRGSSFLQTGVDCDEGANEMFRGAPERMKRKQEHNHLLDCEMSGLRQRAFIDPKAEWENVQNLVTKIAEVYGDQSMQYGVAAKWAAGVGLKLATAASSMASLRLLDAISPVPTSALRNGVPHILSMTPELGLSKDDLDRWLRFALNETPLPAK